MGGDTPDGYPKSVPFNAASCNSGTLLQNVILKEDRTTGIPARFPPRRTGFNSQPDHTRIFASENRAGRTRWPACFLGDLPFPSPFYSGAVPLSLQSPSSALKTSLLRAVQISSLTYGNSFSYKEPPPRVLSTLERISPARATTRLLLHAASGTGWACSRWSLPRELWHPRPFRRLGMCVRERRTVEFRMTNGPLEKAAAGGPNLEWRGGHHLRNSEFPSGAAAIHSALDMLITPREDLPPPPTATLVQLTRPFLRQLQLQLRANSYITPHWPTAAVIHLIQDGVWNIRLPSIIGGALRSHQYAGAETPVNPLRLRGDQCYLSRANPAGEFSHHSPSVFKDPVIVGPPSLVTCLALSQSIPGAGGTGVLRENPSASGIVQHDSLTCESPGVNPTGIEPGLPSWEASALATAPPLPHWTVRRGEFSLLASGMLEVTVNGLYTAGRYGKTGFGAPAVSDLRGRSHWRCEFCPDLMMLSQLESVADPSAPCLGSISFASRVSLFLSFSAAAGAEASALALSIKAILHDTRFRRSLCKVCHSGRYTGYHGTRHVISRLQRPDFVQSTEGLFSGISRFPVIAYHLLIASGSNVLRSKFPFVSPCVPLDPSARTDEVKGGGGAASQGVYSVFPSHTHGRAGLPRDGGTNMRRSRPVCVGCPAANNAPWLYKRLSPVPPRKTPHKTRGRRGACVMGRAMRPVGVGEGGGWVAPWFAQSIPRAATRSRLPDYARQLYMGMCIPRQRSVTVGAARVVGPVISKQHLLRPANFRRGTNQLSLITPSRRNNVLPRTAYNAKDPSAKDFSGVDWRDMICGKSAPVHEGVVNQTAAYKMWVSQGQDVDLPLTAATLATPHGGRGFLDCYLPVPAPLHDPNNKQQN
ncbi:hypothetical protein PR048_031781 [Dryococelus australis]|uniref:Beta-galactosidase n=1 Tax=Dryococelus australis TaxID=614101 RepID=A0ABQ9G919_9NEOP|nr:hypothetical protein PR048_031781 [Dryococelus australis]